MAGDFELLPHFLSVFGGDGVELEGEQADDGQQDRDDDLDVQDHIHNFLGVGRDRVARDPHEDTYDQSGEGPEALSGESDGGIDKSSLGASELLG